ncbi:uncharacterized protein [Dermacentor andersoni]|uniref:uncharacterized protein n=1 Tax=Dermacentor andersoni TaxID=34620 RepID=UPI003B3B2D57
MCTREQRYKQRLLTLTDPLADMGDSSGENCHKHERRHSGWFHQAAPSGSTFSMVMVVMLPVTGVVYLDFVSPMGLPSCVQLKSNGPVPRVTAQVSAILSPRATSFANEIGMMTGGAEEASTKEEMSEDRCCGAPFRRVTKGWRGYLSDERQELPTTPH